MDRQYKKPYGKRKIAVVLSTLNAGGAESRIMDIARHIDRNHYDIDLITLSKDENQFYEEEALSLGIKIIKLNAPRAIGLYAHYRELIMVLSAYPYDAVHSNTSYHCGVVLLAAKRCGIPVRIAHARTDHIRHSGFPEQVALWLGKFLIALCATDRIAISANSARFLFGRRNDVIILQNAIPFDKYCFPDVVEIEQTAVNYKLTGKTIIGHVGRFDDAKNQSFLIRIFAEYIKTHTSNSILVLIGDGQLLKECHELCNELCIQDKVLFLGQRQDVNVWMNLFQVLVFPSKYEGLGNVVIEAQAAGTPCLVSDSVPKETDMGLGIVEFYSLQNSTSKWCQMIDKLLLRERPCPLEIDNAFCKRKYTLSNAIKRLGIIYEGNH